MGEELKDQKIKFLNNILPFCDIYPGDKGYGVDADKTLEVISYTNVNTPNNQWYYIITIKYSGGAARTQIAIPYYQHQSFSWRTISNDKVFPWKSIGG